MKRLQKILAYAIESNRCVEESRQLLSYALIHPATTLDDRSALALWLGHLEERLAGGGGPPARPPRPDAPRRPPPPHEWPEHAATELGPAWPEAAPRENGHPPFHPPASGNGLGGAGERGRGGGKGPGGDAEGWGGTWGGTLRAEEGPGGDIKGWGGC